MRVSSIRSVQRAFAILRIPRKRPQHCNISQISRRLGIPKSTAHVLIHSLEGLGYIARDAGKRQYAARVRFYGVTRRLGRLPWMPERVLPFLEELVRFTGFTVHLAV